MQAQVQLSAQPDPIAHNPPSIGAKRSDAHSCKNGNVLIEVTQYTIIRHQLYKALCWMLGRKAGGRRLDKRAGEMVGVKQRKEDRWGVVKMEETETGKLGRP